MRVPLTEAVEPLVVVLSTIEKSRQCLKDCTQGPNEGRNRPAPVIYREVSNPEATWLQAFSHEDAANLALTTAAQVFTKACLDVRRDLNHCFHLHLV